MVDLFHATVDLLVSLVEQLGYFGIFLGMLLESTPVPIPSEAIMIPAGIAASKGIVDIYWVTILGIVGNICGAAICYYISLHFGRKIILKYGKYFFLKPSIIEKMEIFFAKYGPISVFIGRLLPGFRHFISIPAGLARMDVKLFFIYTTAGSAIWTSILSLFGFFIGENEDLVSEYIHEISIALVITLVVGLALYLISKKIYFKNRNKQQSLS